MGKNLEAGGLVSRLRLMVLAWLVAAVAACSPIYSNHGYVPSDPDLAELEIGKSSRDDVAFAVGRPAAIGVLAGSSWYYVGSRFKQFGLRAPQEIERQVVAITFDENDKVKNVGRYGLKEGKVIAISRRVTESNIEGVGFLRQLLGNIGNVSAADILRQ